MPAHSALRQEEGRMRKQLRLVLVAVCAMLLLGSAAAQRYEWRDVRQHVRIEPDGTVWVHDERTLWTNEDFGEAFLCVNLRGRQRLRLLDDSGAVDSSTPARALVQRCDLEIGRASCRERVVISVVVVCV